MQKLRSHLKAFARGLVAATALAASAALAQPYPSKPVELVIPWPPGGRTDTMVRMLAPFLEKELGQPVVVVNKVGGGGLTGMSFIKNSKPDGYVITSGGVALSSMQYQRKTDLSLWDFDWVARIYSQPLFLAVPASSPFKTLKDFLDYARANPGKLKHGNSGTGSSTHIASEAMAKKLGVKIAQIPYKGEGPAVVGLAGGEADFSLGLMVAFRPFLEGGKLRLLGVTDESRDESAPKVPTFKEQGAEFTYSAWEAINLPKGASPQVLARLEEASRKALTNPQLKEKFAAAGIIPSYQDRATFTKWLRGWDAEMRTMIKEMGLYARD